MKRTPLYVWNGRANFHATATDGSSADNNEGARQKGAWTLRRSYDHRRPTHPTLPRPNMAGGQVRQRRRCNDAAVQQRCPQAQPRALQASSRPSTGTGSRCRPRSRPFSWGSRPLDASFRKLATFWSSQSAIEYTRGGIAGKGVCGGAFVCASAASWPSPRPLPHCLTNARVPGCLL